MSIDPNYRDPEAGPPDPEPRSADEEYPNYKPPLLLIVAYITIFLILALVVGLTPNALGTGIIQIKQGQVYIGVVQSCKGGGCEGWFASGASTGPPKAATDSASTADRERHLLKRATVEDIVPLAQLYLITGLACLFCFYLSLWTLAFVFIRRVFRIPGPPDPQKKERRTWRTNVKILAYRSCRLIVFFEFWTVLGVAADCTRKALKVRSEMKLVGADGIGGGTIALHIAWILLLYAWLMEWSAPKGKLHRTLTPGCFGGCFSCGCAPAGRDDEEGEMVDRAAHLGRKADSIDGASPVPPYSPVAQPAKAAHMGRRKPLGRVPGRHYRA